MPKMLKMVEHWHVVCHLLGSGRLGPVLMSLAAQVKGSSCGDLKVAAFFPSGPWWQMWLKHRANYFMPPATTYMFTCMHVWKYVSYLPKVDGFLRALRFPQPKKLTAMIWQKLLKVALNTNKSNPSICLVLSLIKVEATTDWQDVCCIVSYHLHVYVHVYLTSRHCHDMIYN